MRLMRFKLAINNLLKDIDLSGEIWDDYDKNGHPYWDYLWNEDPITGDAWRLVKRENNDIS